MEHRIVIPPDLLLLMKAIVTIEGIGRTLDPEFDMVKHARPFVKKLVRKKFEPKRMLTGTRKLLTGLIKFIKVLPGQTGQVLQQLKSGKLKIEFQHRGLEELERTLDKVSNRISFSIVSVFYPETPDLDGNHLPGDACREHSLFCPLGHRGGVFS